MNRRLAVGLGVIAAGALLLGLGALAVQQRAVSSREGYVWPMGKWPASDEEWMAIIEKAKRNMNDPEAPWPEPWVPPWVRVVRSCTEVPFLRLERALSVEYSPGNARRRVTVDHGSLRLILYTNQDDLTQCPAHIGKLVEAERFPSRLDSMGNGCMQMDLIAQGKPPDPPVLDPDLGPTGLDPGAGPLPSVRVALAYLEAFCQ